MDEHRTFAGIELGGTKAVAVLARGRTILDRLTIPTEAPATTLPTLARWIDERRDQRPEALGIASFGPVRIDPEAADYGHVLTTPKNGWSGADVVGAFEALRLPLAIDTDVNAAALAEWRWGEGEGLSSLVYVTIGTGVGAGAVIDGQTIKGRLHPEGGHLMLKRSAGDDFAGACAFHGDCVEGLLSGPALRARFGEDPANVSADDPRWAAADHDLAVYIAALIMAYAPQRLVIGGGVGLGARGLIERAKAQVPGLLGGYFPDIDTAALVRTPSLGADSGPLGAVAVAAGAVER